KLAEAAGNDAPADAVAFLVFVRQGPADGDDRIARRDPAPDRGVLQIVPGVSTFSRQADPSKFFIGPAGSTLPCFINKSGQRFESFYPVRLVVVFPVTVLPGRGNRPWRLRWRQGLRRLDELFGQLNLARRGLPLENKAIQLLNPTFRVFQ